MKSHYLLPNKFKKIGWLLFIPSAVLGLLTIINEWEPEILDAMVLGIFVDQLVDYRFIAFIENNILNEILGILVILSAIMIAFSKESDEDEFIANIRLKSLVWATYWNYGILLLAFLLVYNFSFYWVMVFNMYTILLLFIVKFNWSIWNQRKSIVNEE